MKIIITFLFTVQLIIGGIIGVTSLRFASFDRLLFNDVTDVDLIFNENVEAYETFLLFLEREQVAVSRIIFRGLEHIHIYTTDPTFARHLTLSEGSWPDGEVSGFVSNVRHDDSAQIGVIHNNIPSSEVIIQYLDGAAISKDGIYRLGTVEGELLNELYNELQHYDIYFQIEGIYEAQSGLIQALMMGIFGGESWVEIAILIALPIITLICLIASLIQYAMSRIKPSIVTQVHGFSKKRMIGYVVIDLMKALLVAGGLAYLVIIAYLFILNYGYFLLATTLIFMIAFGILSIAYIFVGAFTLYTVLVSCKTHAAIKGFKPDFTVQVINHGLKVLFMGCFLVGTYFLVDHLQEFRIRRADLTHWEIAEHVHHLPISTFWPLAVDQEMSELVVDFFVYLSEQHGAFWSHVGAIYFYEEEVHTIPEQLLPFIDGILMEIEGVNLPFEINPWGNRIDITLNYLELNPITTVTRMPVYDQMVHDVSTINILVPYQFSPYEDEIKMAYLEDFYSLGLHTINFLNETHEEILIERTIDDLSVNIIYVEDNQYYFSFNPRVRVEAGNRIKDPIAVIQTGGMAAQNQVSRMSRSLFFVSDSINPFADIAEAVESFGLTNQYRFTQSAFAEHAQVMATLERDILRNGVLLIALIVTSVTVSYNLLSNYFARNKHTLFTKGLFGYSFMRRHFNFIALFLTYASLIIGMITYFLGFRIVFIASLFLAIDGVLMLEFERRLMKKSFAEMMKGER